MISKTVLKCENSKLPSVSYLGSTKTSEKGYHEPSSHSHPQFSNGPYLTLKKVIGLTEAHQDKFWTKL